MYVRFPLSLRNVEDLLHERGIEISHESVRFWWNRFGPIFAAEIRRNRINQMRAYSNWQWHLDEVFVKINGEQHYLWRAVDHEGEVLESYVTKRRDRNAARPLIAALVISKARGGLPAPGFFECAKRVGLFHGHHSGANASAYYDTEFNRAVEFWQSPSS